MLSWHYLHTDFLSNRNSVYSIHAVHMLFRRYYSFKVYASSNACYRQFRGWSISVIRCRIVCHFQSLVQFPGVSHLCSLVIVCHEWTCLAMTLCVHLPLHLHMLPQVAVQNIDCIHKCFIFWAGWFGIEMPKSFQKDFLIWPAEGYTSSRDNIILKDAWA